MSRLRVEPMLMGPLTVERRTRGEDAPNSTQSPKNPELRATVGLASAALSSHLCVRTEIHAGEVVVYGKVVGNLHARARVDVKKTGSVIGDILTARISIEDGAQFKGRIEIAPAKSQAAAD